MIIFLYGEDSFRGRQKLDELKGKFMREIDPSGNNVNWIDGGTASADEIVSATGAGSLLSKKRMVIVSEIFTSKKADIFESVLAYFKKQKNNDNIIIFFDTSLKIKKTRTKEEVCRIDSAGKESPLAKLPMQLFKFLSGQEYSQHFGALTNSETAAWVKKEFAKRGGEISNQALQVLLGMTGNGLWQLDNEINKLLNYKQSGKLKLDKVKTIIEADDIENLVRGNIDENIFALTDAISAKNKSLAAKLLEEQIEAGVSEGYLISMLTRQFRILLQIKQAIESGESQKKILSSLKLHPFIIQKGMAQARNFTLLNLKNFLGQVAEVDYMMKSGKSDAKTMLFMLIAKI